MKFFLYTGLVTPRLASLAAAFITRLRVFVKAFVEVQQLGLLLVSSRMDTVPSSFALSLTSHTICPLSSMLMTTTCFTLIWNGMRLCSVFEAHQAIQSSIDNWGNLLIATDGGGALKPPKCFSRMIDSGFYGVVLPLILVWRH